MVNGKFFKAAAFLFFVVLVGLRLPAQTVFLSNLSNSSPGGYIVDNEYWLAQPFETGTNPLGYTLDSAQFSMYFGGEAQPPYAYSVSLYTNSSTSTSPDSLSASLTTSDNVNFTPTGTTVLAPSTTYWFVMTGQGLATSTNFIGTHFTYSTDYTSTDDWSLPNFDTIISTDNGATWIDPAEGPLLFSVTAQTAPEPSTGFLVGLGLVALFFVRVRCRV